MVNSKAQILISILQDLQICIYHPNLQENVVKIFHILATVEVVIPTELREAALKIDRFSENLSRHNPRDKIHRGIP